MCCRNLHNFDQNFQTFHLQYFTCDSIHGFDFCDNFYAFNINIEDSKGKNGEKSPKVTLYFLYQSKDPEN